MNKPKCRTCGERHDQGPCQTHERGLTEGDVHLSTVSAPARVSPVGSGEELVGIPTDIDPRDYQGRDLTKRRAYMRRYMEHRRK